MTERQIEIVTRALVMFEGNQMVTCAQVGKRHADYKEFYAEAREARALRAKFQETSKAKMPKAAKPSKPQDKPNLWANQRRRENPPTRQG